MNDLEIRVELSWVTFSVPNPKKIETIATEIVEAYKTYYNMKQELKSYNTSISGVFKIDGKEIFYDNCNELIDKLDKMPKVYDNPFYTYQFVFDVRDSATREKKAIINSYIEQTEQKIDIEQEKMNKHVDSRGELYKKARDAKEKLEKDLNTLKSI